jgi:NIMA (never in mitosis gene a)-related kinase
MEFMDNGDLGGLIKAHKSLKKPISEEKIMNIFIQAMKSLAFIHSHNLIHRDIKPENLFISNDGTLKLGDFGVSASIVEKKDNNKYKNIQEQIQKELISKWICKGTCVGTPPFMSPEMLQKSEYNLNSDVYSMGCTFFETMFWIFPRAPVIDLEAIMNGRGEMKLVDLPIKNNENYYLKN